MMPKRLAICVLAHNEEKAIGQTLSALTSGIDHTNLSSDIPVHVFANGCTDKTVQVGNKFALDHRNIFIKEVTIASKIKTWNLAFSEVDYEYLIFCDGDVTPSRNCIEVLLRDIESHPELIISSTRLLPKIRGLGFQKGVVGFMQLPLKHEYLSGGMYIVCRDRLRKKFAEKNLSELPPGIAGEDAFLESLLTSNEFSVSDCFNYYEPPNFSDYIRYLARLRWQNEQLNLITPGRQNSGFMHSLRRKFLGHSRYSYLFVAVPAVFTRMMFKFLFRNAIAEKYSKLGPIQRDGEAILTQMTRSNSTR
jgi:glycosyltransferase involved in cell wall biosynthesis